jgi:DNA-binding protein HU-beta
MAVKPVDRIRTMITDLERGARSLGDDIRKRAGNVTVTSDLEKALRQFMQGLTSIAVQLEKAASELRRYLEQGAAADKPRARKAKAARKPAGQKASKKASKAATSAKKSPARKAPAKAVGKKPAAKKSR